MTRLQLTPMPTIKQDTAISEINMLKRTKPPNKWNGLNRNKRPRLVSDKTRKRNELWREICLQRAEYLIKKYGRLVCEYSGETIRYLTTTFNDHDDAWGHHIDGKRNNCTPDNCYIVKYKYHRIITEQHIQVSQEDFQGGIKGWRLK